MDVTLLSGVVRNRKVWLHTLDWNSYCDILSFWNCSAVESLIEQLSLMILSNSCSDMRLWESWGERFLIDIKAVDNRQTKIDLSRVIRVLHCDTNALYMILFLQSIEKKFFLHSITKIITHYVTHKLLFWHNVLLLYWVHWMTDMLINAVKYSRITDTLTDRLIHSLTNILTDWHNYKLICWLALWLIHW